MKKKRGGKGGGGLSLSAKLPAKKADNGKSNDRGSTSRSVSLGRSSNRKPLTQSTPVRTRTAKTGGGGPPRKRRVIVQLPPPWHDKDPKRLSQSQQDDLLFNQKSNIN